MQALPWGAETTPEFSGCTANGESRRASLTVAVASLNDNNQVLNSLLSVTRYLKVSAITQSQGSKVAGSHNQHPQGSELRDPDLQLLESCDYVRISAFLKKQ
ncbi:unnamed protein product [Caretta caretta]